MDITCKRLFHMSALLRCCDASGHIHEQVLLVKISCCSCTVSLSHRTLQVQVRASKVTWHAPPTPQLHVVAALTGLHGSRSDWLIEKCTELGADAITPLLTQHAPALHRAESPPDVYGKLVHRQGSRWARWQRVAEAAVKQSLRLHRLEVSEPWTVQRLVEEAGKAGTVTLVGVLGGSNVLRAFQECMPRHRQQGFGSRGVGEQVESSSGVVEQERVSGDVRNVVNRGLQAEGGLPKRLLLAVGPPGDFTLQELEQLQAAGAVLVGLGRLRLRVETAALVLLAASMLHCEQNDG